MTISSGRVQNLFEVYGTLVLQGQGTLSLQNGSHTVYVREGGRVFLKSGSIAGAGERRCAVLVSTEARFFMTGGSIAGDGLETTVRVAGVGDKKGSITGGQRCLGVDANMTSASLTISDRPEIPESMTPSGSQTIEIGQVFLYSGAKIEIMGKPTLTEGSQIAVDASPMPKNGSPYAITSVLSNEVDEGFFTSANDMYAVRKNAGGEAQLTLLHSIGVSEDIEHGRVIVGEQDTAKACAGDRVIVTVTPEENYALRSLSYKEDGDETKTAFTLETGFLMPDTDVTVYAEFDNAWSVLRSRMAKGEETPRGQI